MDDRCTDSTKKHSIKGSRLVFTKFKSKQSQPNLKVDASNSDGVSLAIIEIIAFSSLVNFSNFVLNVCLLDLDVKIEFRKYDIK